VSFEKGCYLGQEVIARIHFRGKVNRSLRGLVFPQGARPGTGLALRWSEETVGVMNSVADSPVLGCSIGLAVVHHKAAVGCELSTDAGPCKLVELPFELETA
jgi:folate-binding Fe-S cluster repair protein YgfZ